MKSVNMLLYTTTDKRPEARSLVHVQGSCVIYMKDSRKIYRVVFDQAEKNLLQKQTLAGHFYLSTHPSEKLVFALSGTRTYVSLITSQAC